MNISTNTFYYKQVFREYFQISLKCLDMIFICRDINFSILIVCFFTGAPSSLQMSFTFAHACFHCHLPQPEVKSLSPEPSPKLVRLHTENLIGTSSRLCGTSSKNRREADCPVCQRRDASSHPSLEHFCVCACCFTSNQRQLTCSLRFLRKWRRVNNWFRRVIV